MARTTQQRQFSVLRTAFLLMVAFGFTGLALAAEDATVSIDLTPKPETKVLITQATKSNLLISGKHVPQPVRMLDVLTSTFEVRAGDRDFLGGMALEVEFIDSRGQTVSGGFNVSKRSSPLEPFLGDVLLARVTRDGKIVVQDDQADNRKQAALLEVATRVLRPFSPPGKVKVGHRFQHREERKLDFEQIKVPVEQLERYTVKEMRLPKVLIEKQTVIRPASPKQRQKVFGRGEGEIVVDTDLGIITRADDRLRVEAKIAGPKGQVSYVSETETEFTGVPLADGDSQQ